MATVTQEMVKKAGVNLDELIDLLVKNAAAEHHPQAEPDRP